MRKVIGLAVFVVLVVALIVKLNASPAGNAYCTFDGGGTIDNGQSATVTTGQTFQCDNGTLVEIDNGW